MGTGVDDLVHMLTEIGCSKEEIRQRIDEFKNFMSEEAILFLMAQEKGLNLRSSRIDPDVYDEIAQGIDYDEFTIKVSEVKEGMKSIVLLGRIERIFGVHTFAHKNGTPGVVGSFVINDGSGRMKIVLWGEQSEIMESEHFKVNEIVRIIGDYSKNGWNNQLEVHVSGKGTVVLAPENGNSSTIPSIQELETNKGDISIISGTVSAIEEFSEHDLSNGEKSFLLKYLINDGTSTVRVVVRGMNAVECLKAIDEGVRIKLLNVWVKFNSYTNQDEIIFTRKSTLVKI
ncbi:MAG: hypothetical protein ACFFAH_08085 [Promethearchaeota archaeon]